MSGMPIEAGAEYSKQRLRGKQYFSELLGQLEEVPASVKHLLRLSRSALDVFETTQRHLARPIAEPLPVKRVKLPRA